jgi:outer membrane receptor protein involved in Fe transport
LPHRDWSLKANVGRYARFASFNELYGDSGFIRGNPDLRPESGTTGDLGAAWRQTGGAFAAAAEVFVFANIVADLIHP